MATRRLFLVSSAVLAALVLLSAGTYALLAGRNRTGNQIGHTLPGQFAAAAALTSQTANDAAAGVSGSALAAPATAYAYPYPGPGPFQPGPPPFGQIQTGDGLSAWGVAFKEVSDENAQPSSDLVKSAYQDGAQRADNLASAAGIKLGKLLAISDYSFNEPYFNKACMMPMMGAPGKAQSGSAPGGATIVEPAPPTRTAPEPAPTPCQSKHYVVVWVSVRYAIGS
jgi:hypothetical protein